MKRLYKGLVLTVCALSALGIDLARTLESALAQEFQYENPYALKKKKAQGPLAHVDVAFAKTLSGKLSTCYEAEQGKPLTAEERALLETYGTDVARDLAPALSATTCSIGQAASEACAKELEQLPCETLAQPIIEVGWDRNLTPEAKAQVAKYAHALGAREGACSGRAADEQAIVGDIQVTRLGVLIESSIVTGRCELLGEKLGKCEAALANMSCNQIEHLHEQGQLIQACDDLLRCRELPVDLNK